MQDTELMKRLTPTGKVRVSLYLAPSKIEHLYLQTVTVVTEVTRGRHGHGKVSGGLLGFLTAEISAESGLETRVAVNPLLQALVAERAASEAHELLDLASTRPEHGKVLRYYGPARFVTMRQDVVEVVANDKKISESAANLIDQRRKDQEEILRFRDDKIRTLVLIFQANHTQFAAIASSEFLDLSAASSYFSYNRFGILCRLEGSATEDVTFVDPLWIWYEDN